MLLASSKLHMLFIAGESEFEIETVTRTRHKVDIHSIVEISFTITGNLMLYYTFKDRKVLIYLLGSSNQFPRVNVDKVRQ